jgi:hypothetical protein
MIILPNNVMINTVQTNDEIHLFYRQTSRESFVYHGQIQLLEIQKYMNQPSRFLFKLKPSTSAV